MSNSDRHDLVQAIEGHVNGYRFARQAAAFDPKAARRIVKQLGEAATNTASGVRALVFYGKRASGRSDDAATTAAARAMLWRALSRGVNVEALYQECRAALAVLDRLATSAASISRSTPRAEAADAGTWFIVMLAQLYRNVMGKPPRISRGTAFYQFAKLAFESAGDATDDLYPRMVNAARAVPSAFR